MEPHVAINNRGWAVEVHQAAQDTTSWIHVALADQFGTASKFGNSHPLDRHVAPAVAIDQNGLVIVAHNDSPSGTLSYRIGQFTSDDAGPRIDGITHNVKDPIPFGDLKGACKSVAMLPGDSGPRSL